MMLLIIPAIIFAVSFRFSLYVFIFENLNGIDAMKKSKKLVAGYWWPVFARFLLLGVIFIIADIIFGKLGQLINLFITTPFALIYTYVMYQDLQKIKQMS